MGRPGHRSLTPRRWAWLIVIAIAVLAGATYGRRYTDGVLRHRVRVPGNAQARFAGFYAAAAQGYYAAEGLSPAVEAGGTPTAVVDAVGRGQAAFGVAWLVDVLVAQDAGVPVQHIAQLFAAGGLRHVSRKGAGTVSPRDYRGKRVAVWFGGREYPLLATLEKYGLGARDVTLVQQRADVALFLAGEVAATAAMSYDEVWHILQAGLAADDLAILDFNREGTAVLEDGIVVNEGWLQEPAHKDLAVRFLRATLKGWEYCRAHPAECVELVLKENPRLDRAHQTWMMAEVNKLVWGGPGAAALPGRLDPVAFHRTARILLKFGALRRPPDAGAYTHEIWRLATGKP